MSTHAKVENVLLTKFNDFIDIAFDHYVAQYKMTNETTQLKQLANADFTMKLDLAADYFVRNRSRLFEWYCSKTDNALSANDEFKVLCDVFGFDFAFKKMCHKLFDVDVVPDEKHYSILTISENAIKQTTLSSIEHLLKC